MRLLHYIEIENFKRFGDKQRIELDHPAVLIGPNNCGKTSAIQALALWSQAVRTWYDVRKDSSAKERTATSLNRLSIVAVPVSRTRYFWHNTRVQRVPLTITVGVEFKGQIEPLTMRFTHRGDELVYCSPDESVMCCMWRGVQTLTCSEAWLSDSNIQWRISGTSASTASMYRTIILFRTWMPS